MIWGVYYGVLLLFEKLLFGKYLEKLPPAVRHIYTMFSVMIGCSSSPSTKSPGRWDI